MINSRCGPVCRHDKMSESVSKSAIKSTRVLFLAWGFSIHAKRRIQLFVDDPHFAVAVVSTHNYNFEDAKNFLLTGKKVEKQTDGSFISRKEPLLVKGQVAGIRGSLRKILDKLEPRPKDFKVIQQLLSTLGICSEVGKAIKDFQILKSAVEDFNPDVVFLQTLFYPCYLAYFLPQSVPIIVTFWNGDVTWWAKWTGVERLMKKQLVRHGVHRATAITVNSQKALDACLRYGVQAEKINLIRYPGVELKRFKPLPKMEARKVLAIASRKVVLCPRGLGGYLNSDIIVASAPSVVKQYPDTLFLFISDVGGESELRKHYEMALELGIEENVRWEGHVSWDTMPTYYASSDVMVSLSSNDSLPNCMLEAMACGVPVIMGDIPQIREWILDGVNGFLVPPRSPVALSEKIIEVFEGFNWNVKALAEGNRERVGHEVDSVKNARQVKNLVRWVAGYQNGLIE